MNQSQKDLLQQIFGAASTYNGGIADARLQQIIETILNGGNI